MNASHSPWVIVLAGGSGTRLQQLTVDAAGRTVPKQFCSLRGGSSLLVDAIHRALQIAPREHVVVVVTAEHEPWWQPQLRGLLPANILVQPHNRGTATGLLLALAAIRQRDAHARIAVLPSDHFVEHPAVLLEALGQALASLRERPDRLVLLGITPDNPDTEYGWIVPGRRDGEFHRVLAFVEKPPLARAEQLYRHGSLWNSFLCVADAAALWAICEHLHPELTVPLAALRTLAPEQHATALDRTYATLPVVDFSRDVLQGAETNLRLLPVPACGWTDLGTPGRVASCLQHLANTSAGRRPPRAPWFPTVDLARVLQARQPSFAV